MGNKTIALITNQYSCARLILAAREIADRTNTDLVVVNVQDSEYEIDPQATDFLFMQAKQQGATMRLAFAEDKLKEIERLIAAYDCSKVVTGMPSSSNSVLYGLWKRFADREFFVVDEQGVVSEVAAPATVNA